MNQNIRDTYALILKKKKYTSILKLTPLPGNWVGVLFADYSLHALRPFLRADGSLGSISLRKTLISNPSASERYSKIEQRR